MLLSFEGENEKNKHRDCLKGRERNVDLRKDNFIGKQPNLKRILFKTFKTSLGFCH